MTNEEKLKEDIQKEWDNLKRFPTTGQELNEYVLKCVTSEASREYWQQQQASDMEEVRNKFLSKFRYFDNQPTEDVDNIMSFFAPMIKGSDAVEFAEWIQLKGYRHTPEVGRFKILDPHNEVVFFTTTELYELFKQTKTNNG